MSSGGCAFSTLEKAFKKSAIAGLTERYASSVISTALVGRVKNYAVTSSQEDQAHNFINFMLEDVTIDHRLVFSSVEEGGLPSMLRSAMSTRILFRPTMPEARLLWSAEKLENLPDRVYQPGDAWFSSTGEHDEMRFVQFPQMNFPIYKELGRFLKEYYSGMGSGGGAEQEPPEPPAAGGGGT